MQPYLKSRSAGKDKPHTHTRIGDKSNGIFGGSYAIPDSEEKQFMNLYYDRVFVKKELEYMTEHQLSTRGPILIDIDLHYPTDITKRQHTEDHVVDLVMEYANTCIEMLTIPGEIAFDVYVMEKNDVNITNKMTKDGIHIIIGLAMDRAPQLILRKRMLSHIASMWEDLPVSNNWDDVLDESVSKANSNWQMYGSRKPGHQAYSLKYQYHITYDPNGGGELAYEPKKVADFNLKENFHLLSARNDQNPYFEITQEVAAEIASIPQKSHKKATYTLKTSVPNNILPRMNEIRSQADLDAHIENWFNGLSSDSSNIKESVRIKDTHAYTMSLPKEYYGPGSFSKWIRVGWALANTNSSMFLTWLKFSSQDGCRNTLRGYDDKFDWNQVDELWEQWQTFEINNPDGLTSRSIQYWSKADAPQKHEEIKQTTLDYYIEESLTYAAEFDLAMVLWILNREKYACVSIKNNIWYEYNGHRWFEIDSGSTLRYSISDKMCKIYLGIVQDITSEFAQLENEDPQSDDYRKRIKQTSDIISRLKTTQWKNNIMREARELFFDNDFIEKLDQNPFLLCFNNGIVDFKANTFRPGQPDDYVSKCTNIKYEPLDGAKHAPIIQEITTFFDQLFPVTELREYMWEHLASVLLGTNDNQTFNIYTGSGANGKSMMVDLMSRCLGTYKGVVPLTLITQSRTCIGSTSSEIAQLIGVRYAVMQEPSKNEKMNEGIMKEITGGDPIQGRALFKDTITFIPQFKLVVCTNTLFDIKSNDDGTWRRIRLCDFMSKFHQNPYQDEAQFPKEDYPYQYYAVANIKQRFDAWAPVLMAMLVEKAYETDGKVTDRDIVKNKSNMYRLGQDYLCEFFKEKIERKADERIKKMELSEEFANWYKVNYGSKPPQAREIYDYMDSKVGKYKPGGWQNVAINYDA